MAESILASVTSVNEGSSFTYTLNGLSSSTTYSYDFNLTNLTTSNFSSDISGTGITKGLAATSGGFNFTTDGSATTATVTVTTVADNSTAAGSQSIDIALTNSTTSTTAVAASANPLPVTVADTSQTPVGGVRVYKTTSAVNESGTATFFATGLEPGASYIPTFGTAYLANVGGTGANTNTIGGVSSSNIVSISDIDASSKSGTGPTATLKSVKADAKGVAVFSIKLAQDASTEGTENFSISVGGATSGVMKVYDSSTLPAKAVIPSTLSVNEGGGINYSISAPDGTYTYAFTGTATALTDYTVTPSTTVKTDVSTVKVNNGVGTLSIKTLEDNTVEGPDTLILTLTPPGGATASNPVFAAATVNINDTSSGIPSLVASNSVNEGGSVTFTLSNIKAGDYPYTLSGAVNVAPAATVYNAVGSSSTQSLPDIGTATLNSNGSFTGTTTATTGTIRVAATKTSVALTVPVNADRVTEGAEALKLVLGAPTIANNAALVTAVTGLEANVLVNDSSVAYTYKLSPSVSTVNEGASVTFSISDGKPGATVGYRIKDFTPATTTDFSATITSGDFTTTQGGSTAIPALTSNVGTVILDGSGKATFPIFIKADGNYDGGGTGATGVKLAEKFQVVLNDNAGTPVDIAVVGTNLVTINDTSFA